MSRNSPTMPVALESCWRNGACVSDPDVHRGRGEAKSNTAYPFDPFSKETAHTLDLDRKKNIPLSEAKGHHVISSCAWKGSLEQVI